MTTLELNKLIGREVSYVQGPVSFACRVVDAKISYGQERVLIEPLSGSGCIWVATSSVVFT